MKHLRWLLAIAFLVAGSHLHAQSCVTNSQVTLTGALRSSNGLPARNLTINVTPTQTGFIAGCGVNLPIANYCATSTDGSVVGLSNPVTASVDTTSGSGSLPSGTYYTVYTFYDALGHQSLPSPETVRILSMTGSIVVNSPSSGLPAGAVGMYVYISTTSGTETKQGSTTGTAAYTQSTALFAGAALPSSNNTLCQLTANDSIWPTGTGYKVSLVDVNGNPIPGYPMTWQLMGAGNTINLSNGLPYYNGVVQYPVPILASPLNHATQSISGSLAFGGYNILNVGKIGVGTSVPGWSIDVENGLINTNAGYLVDGGGGTTGQCLISDGTAYDTPATCLTAGGSFSAYQIAQAAGTPLTQRTTFNFDGTVAATDSSSPARTNVGLPNKGAPGTYAQPASITFDAQGRETAITAGSAVNRACTSTDCYFVQPDGTIVEWGSATGCANADNAGCTEAITFPLSFTTTTNLTITVGTSGAPLNCMANVQSPSVSGFTMSYGSFVEVGGGGSHCTGSQTGPWFAIGR